MTHTSLGSPLSNSSESELPYLKRSAWIRVAVALIWVGAHLRRRAADCPVLAVGHENQERLLRRPPNQLVQGRSLYPKGRRTQTMASPQAIAAFRVQALERSRFAVGRLPAAYGDWSARPLACRSEGNGVRWVRNCLAELTTRLVSALRPSIAVARGDRATVRTRDFPSSPPMGDSFWLGL